MPHDQRKQLILDTFLKAATRRSDQGQRVQNGLYLRAQFQQALQQGLVPQHPRFEWVRKQARAILELLLTLPKDYDATNPAAGDAISMADLLDICDMTHGHITGIIQAGLLDPAAVELVPFDQVKPEVTVESTQPESTPAEEASTDDGEDPEDG